MRMRHRVRAGVLAAAGALALLAGCRSGEWRYDKPRATTAQLDRDLTQCRQLARPKGAFAFPSLTGPDQDELNACMRKRGYTVTPP
jgi:hypothetical protein